MKKKPLNTKQDSKDGFTLIEVMLALAITGLMLVGIIGGSYTSIARQRYNDALNSFAEYLSRVYSEVLSPESLGQGNSDSNDGGNLAILGKVLVFGHDYGDEDANRSVYSATLVGTAEISRPSDHGFLNELANTSSNVQLFCGNDRSQSTVSSYLPLWQTELVNPTNVDDPSQSFRGTVIISRTPTSNVIHTAFAPNVTYNLRDECTQDNQNANIRFVDQLRDIAHNPIYSLENQVRICLESEDSPISREIDLAVDGSNTSAVSILSEGESQCR